jgi:hypothetical protein
MVSWQSSVAGSVWPAMSAVKRVMGLFEIFRSDQQLGSTHGRVHSASIVSPDHGLDPGLVQDAFGHLRIRGGPECRDGDQT